MKLFAILCVALSALGTSSWAELGATSMASNNGQIRSISALPSPSSSGQPSATERLTFGINTSANNGITTETVFDLDSFGYLTTTYGGTVYSQSYIDSGSNGIFFTDNTITRCKGHLGFIAPEGR